MDDLIFISAQPDQHYFHWQVELYLYQFAKHGIKDKCYAVFAYYGKGPSQYIQDLAKTYNIRWYKDERPSSGYIPSVRPHVLKKFFKEHPELGKNVFYHDSDIFLVKMPPFEEMLKDDVGYLSDTISYIGHDYIVECSKRYKAKHPELPDNDILQKMCDCIGISVDLVKQNEKNSGGAQYLLKGIDEQYWQDAETDCYKLFNMMKAYEKKYPIDHHIQTWTTDMWCVLWEYWKRGKETRIHKELAFSWATDSRLTYHKRNIFHLAGITESSPKTHFFKGRYKDTNIFDRFRENPQMFDDISEDSITIEYTNVIKELMGVKPSVPEKKVNTIIIDTDDHWSGVYEKDFKTQHFGKEIWRSTDKKYIMFWNSNVWMLTASQYESEISKTCGGFKSYSSLDQLY